MMDRTMGSQIIMHKSSHKMDRFLEKLSRQHHSNLRNGALTQTRARSGAMRILLQEKEQKSQEHVMNAGERR